MIATLLALQATVTEALPADVSNAATQTLAQATTGGGINYLELMAKASLPVKIIVLLLLVGSFVSWVIIFRKARVFKQATREADEFENRFWSGADLGKLYSAATDRSRSVTGLEAIFEAGFREYTRLRDKRRWTAVRSWKARSVPCVPPTPAKWTSLSATRNCWPISARPPRTWVWSVPCSASW